MSIVPRPHTYTPNTTISSSQANANEDTLYNDYNGNISAANLATDAVTTAKIADSNVTTAKINDSAVTTAKINNAAITPEKISTGAILLGYAQRTSNVAKTSSIALVTGLEVTVTIPSGGRMVKITAFTRTWTTDAAADQKLSIWDGTVGSGTKLAEGQTYMANTGTGYSVGPVIAAHTPSAGSKTYRVGAQSSAGNQTILASATEPAFILVELI